MSPSCELEVSSFSFHIRFMAFRKVRNKNLFRLFFVFFLLFFCSSCIRDICLLRPIGWYFFILRCSLSGFILLRVALHFSWFCCILSCMFYIINFSLMCLFFVMSLLHFTGLKNRIFVVCISWYLFYSKHLLSYKRWISYGFMKLYSGFFRRFIF